MHHIDNCNNTRNATRTGYYSWFIFVPLMFLFPKIKNWRMVSLFPALSTATLFPAMVENAELVTYSAATQSRLCVVKIFFATALLTIMLLRVYGPRLSQSQLWLVSSRSTSCLVLASLDLSRMRMMSLLGE